MSGSYKIDGEWMAPSAPGVIPKKAMVCYAAQRASASPEQLERNEVLVVIYRGIAICFYW